MLPVTGTEENPEVVAEFVEFPPVIEVDALVPGIDQLPPPPPPPPLSLNGTCKANPSDQLPSVAPSQMRTIPADNSKIAPWSVENWNGTRRLLPLLAVCMVSLPTVCVGVIV
jgi:hypothetical protein